MAAKLTKRWYTSRFFSYGPNSVSDNLQTSNHHWTGDMTDTRTDGGFIKDWKKRIREHTSATTNVSGVRWKVERVPTSGSVTQSLRSSSGLGPYISTVRYNGYPWPARTQAWSPASSISDGVAEREATKKFYRKINQQKKALEGLVFMGELRETLRMLRNPAKSLFDSAQRDYLGALQKRKKRDPKNWARGLSGAWLEWAFGVLPLTSDIKNILDGMDRFNADPIRTKVITGVGRQTEKSTANSEHVWSPDNNELVFTGLTRYSLKQKVKFRGCYMRERSEIKNLSESQKLADTFGVNAREFIPAAWELMPWSFLIDYFSNIGDILEQTFVNLENMRWINKTVVDESLTEIHSNLNHARTAAAIFFAGWSQIVSSSPGADARVSVNRVGFSRGAGGLYVSPFVLEIPGSLQKWLNITALGIQANSIHPQRFMRFARG
jgi:hypothetical protein